MKLHGILSIGVVLAVIHVAHSIDCMYYGNFNDFSTNLYQAVLNDPSVEKNFISSPLSVAMVLLMAGFGARGSTAAELNRFFHSESLNECTVRIMTAELNSYKNVELSLANTIFANIKFHNNAEFENSVKFASIFGIEWVDFGQCDDAVRKINNWCKRKTNSRIQELLKPDDVDADTKLVLVNAVYFKGKWAQSFDKSLTKPRPFKLADGQVKNVPTMSTTNVYFYGRLPELSATFIELPYESENPGDGVSMFIILPDKHDGLSKVENGIRGLPLKMLRSEEMKIVDLTIPSFKIESKFELTNILQSMGMEEIFSDGSDFSGISEYGNWKISKIVQKAFIEVNEEGSEAAAEDLVSGGHLVFKVDHPFLVMIATENVILFSGRVNDPLQ